MLLRAARQVDIHQFGRLTDQAEKQTDLVAVAGEIEVVELHGESLALVGMRWIVDRPVCIFQAQSSRHPGLASRAV
ncbi:hypothetical protein Pres01_15590 [Metapseudomonas resinovorans]|nr:hypothetical protein Pres01_15590 [Pseudomonas resinovorans]